jgi:hypothetical protein
MNKFANTPSTLVYQTIIDDTDDEVLYRVLPY